MSNSLADFVSMLSVRRADGTVEPFRIQPYNWRIEGAKAAKFMGDLRPFMSPKRQTQIDVSLAKWDAWDSRERVPHTERLRKGWATRRANGWTHPGFKGRYGPRMKVINGGGA